jgi:hypothetical protein
MRQRLLVIEVADEADPYFHHALAVGEAEFTDLKAEQAILVEFAAFPAHFVELLQCCRASASVSPGSTGASSSSPAHSRGGGGSAVASSAASALSSGSFGLQLTIRDAAAAAAAPSILAVVETNAFKHLAHLSLSLRASNDAGLKRYLAARLQHTQAALRRSQESGAAVAGALERSRAAHEAAAAELASLRSDAASRETSLRAGHAAELSAAREAATAQLAAVEAAARTAAAEAAARHADAAASLLARAEEAAGALLACERAKAAVEVSRPAEQWGISACVCVCVRVCACVCVCGREGWRRAPRVAAHALPAQLFHPLLAFVLLLLLLLLLRAGDPARPGPPPGLNHRRPRVRQCRGRPPPGSQRR